MQTLPALRKEIDAIDDRILSLLAERIKIAQVIAALKKAKKMPVFQKDRELEVLSRISSTAKDLELPEVMIQNIFKMILQASREEQKRILEK